MRISDSVANYILQMLNDENGIAEIQRNELANTLGCVPSQINYVITSRFTPEQGYIVESRRGGGGYVDRMDFFAQNIRLYRLVRGKKIHIQQKVSFYEITDYFEV